MANLVILVVLSNLAILVILVIGWFWLFQGFDYYGESDGFGDFGYSVESGE